MEDIRRLYEEYGDKIYCFLFSLSRDEHVSEDLTQETILRAILNIRTFRGDSEILVWLFQIAKNLYFEWYNKRKRFVSISELEGSIPSDVSIELNFIDKESAKQILTYLHQLSEPYKEVFLLHALGEIPLKEISLMFGKSDSWGRVTYYRAKAMIIQKLKGE